MILKAVFLLSLSSLTLEVLLTRVFSINQWNHLSFMVISIALFGFAASGTFLGILNTRSTQWEKRLSTKRSLFYFICLYAVFTIISFLLLNNMPLDYFRLPLDPVQAIYLLTAFVFLALPFFFAGLTVGIAYSFLPEKSGLVYFSTMAGSACGALFPIPLLPFLGEGKLIVISALFPVIMMPLKWPWRKSDHPEKEGAKEDTARKKQGSYKITGFSIVISSILLISPVGDFIIKIKPSQYKALSQVLRFPHTRITRTVNDLKGRIDHVNSKYIRFAPGLSLKYADKLPVQSAGFKDGDHPFVFYDLQTQEDALFSQFTLPYSGYVLSPEGSNVLLIQHGGGTAIPCAVASGAKQITIIAQNPEIAETVRRQYNLPVINRNPRSFLAGSHQRFDIIHVENWGTSIPGMAALKQNHLLTIDAFIQYLNHLADNGFLIISRKLLLPPADSIRLFGVAYESLKSLEVESPKQHIVILRNWDTFTLIVSANPFKQKELAIIKKFAGNCNFDLVYFSGISSDMANIFNVFDQPYHFIEISRLAKAYQSGTDKSFFQSYFLDVSPQTDNRPFPSRILKWSGFKTLYKSTGSRLYSILMSGEIVVSVVFLEALVISIFLLILPLLATTQKRKRPVKSHVFYFLAVGAGFMFLELFFIKNYILLLGNPTVSFTIVVSGILVFSSMGAIWSQHLSPHNLKKIFLTLILLLVVVFLSLDDIVRHILAFPSFLRYFLALLLLLPAGFLIGLPFPMGMRYLLKSPVERAYAWTANGCTSVLSAILSAQIAISWGISTILVCSVLSYALAFLCIVKHDGFNTTYL
ncbi:MAG: hypothetical protein SWH54_17130 [Thermodesulfobacteriota bacterium]|nr:hypothetical protein [Thermodesulfobacteriota bacterium]